MLELLLDDDPLDPNDELDPKLYTKLDTSSSWHLSQIIFLLMVLKGKQMII